MTNPKAADRRARITIDVEYDATMYRGWVAVILLCSDLGEVELKSIRRPGLSQATATTHASRAAFAWAARLGPEIKVFLTNLEVVPVAYAELARP
jgi:hypothetical protein